MRITNVTFAGVDVTSVPKKFRKCLPQGHYNFFEVPWNMSCPGRGLILVTTNQLQEIAGAANHDEGNDLSLLVDGGDSNEQTVLHNIFMVKATPVWGEFYRHQGITPEGNLNSLSALADTPTNSMGLWFLELQDKRNWWLRRSQQPLSTAVFNVTTGATKYVPETAKSETEPYTDKEILSLMCPEMSITGSAIDTDTKMRDVFLVGLPSPISADLILHNRGKGETFKFDPAREDGRFNIVKIDDATQDLLGLIFPYRLTGGSVITYPAFENKPGAVAYRKKKSGKADYSDYYEPQTGSQWTLLTDLTRERGIGSQPGVGAHGIPVYHHRMMYHALYRGFLNSCLLDHIPVSLVKFCWHNSVPSTEIHIGQQSPIRTMLEGPTGRFLAEHPLPISFQGQIGLPAQFNQAWHGVISLCNHQEGWAMVLPDGETDNTKKIKVALVNHSWHQGGDTVTVIPTDSGYEIMDHIPIAYKPPTGATEVVGTLRDACQDALPNA